MSTKVEPTAGAMRAANSINMYNGDVHYQDDIEEWAEIIDRETAAPEMLEALEALADTHVSKAMYEAVKPAMQLVMAAIKKAKGEL